MKKLTALAALTMAGLALAAAPAHAAPAPAGGDALDGIADGLSVSPGDLVLQQAAGLPVAGGPVKGLQALTPRPGTVG
ncbi:hypothetical protein OG689_19415 [Kitasatospora sp. NBC_00240]|uniref:hypothetical protein n=1 Tax=Kitasatospora sp. NBC_00240 TaxID=2903567 RepID=UPI002254A015|nr:hypothetical protein [Kitasatospora sp. NBC_00240]MCX5211430.1 hypothetical protein [Kitasatospora sp. NBC_00240]